MMKLANPLLPLLEQAHHRYEKALEHLDEKPYSSGNYPHTRICGRHFIACPMPYEKLGLVPELKRSYALAMIAAFQKTVITDTNM